jgi:hypothetical protein
MNADNYTSPHTDAADRPEASYEAHPIDAIEPVPDLAIEALPMEQKAMIYRLVGQAFEPVLRFLVEEIKITGRTEKHSTLTATLREKTVTLRTIATAYALRPELFGGVSATEVARRLGINKQRLNWYVTMFKKRLHYQSQVMRTKEACENMKEAMTKSHARRTVKILREGRTAALAGEAIESNPYPEGKQKWKHWRAGFTQEAQH